MRARKVDATQRSIVRALERSGCLVWVANGALDLIVCRAGQLHLLECKTGRNPHITLTQRRMIIEGWPVRIVCNEDEALKAVGL